MANYNEIHEFAEKWIDKYRDQKINYIELVDHYFADDCGRLGFEMDCGKAFTFCGSTRFKRELDFMIFWRIYCRIIHINT